MLTEKHWQKILVALPMLAIAAGLEPSEEACFNCIRTQWDLLGNEDALTKWIDVQHVANMKVSKAHLEGELARVTTAIEDAEAKD